MSLGERRNGIQIGRSVKKGPKTRKTIEKYVARQQCVTYFIRFTKLG